MPIAADPDWDDVEGIVADGDVPADAFPVLVGLVEPQPVITIARRRPPAIGTTRRQGFIAILSLVVLA
ncbi:MAG: hypothetical protein NVS3B21_18570 [Acidimicrobiales bacterium]